MSDEPRVGPPPIVPTVAVAPQPELVSDLDAVGGVVPGAVPELAYEAGLEVQARSQWWYARRRFMRHRLAMGALVVLAIIFLAGAFANFLAPYSPTAVATSTPLTIGPTTAANHFFGTDYIGHDWFSRALFGIRATEEVSLLVAALATAIGVLVGAVAGFLGGWIDNILMRITDTFLAVPVLAVLLVAAKFLGHGSPFRLAVIIALLLWVNVARIVRGIYLSLKEKEYVEAARAAGAGNLRMMFRHILPNTIGPIAVAATLTTAVAILFEASISFLGFGLDISLGKMLNDAQEGLQLNEWWLILFPGILIVAIILCINLIGDGLRDALDPTQRRVRA
jgi:ABC-type dipeptide/oligopeptide/nickel transport system permease subunit